MELQAFKEELKFKLTGGLLDIELDDAALTQLITYSLREISRYIDETTLLTTQFCKAIDLSKYNVNTVTAIYRTDSFNNYLDTNSGFIDPMWLQQWQFASTAGGLMQFSNFASNFTAYNTILQIRNTITTDLSFYFDKSKNMLYINTVDNTPQCITIEFIPIYTSVSQIQTEYWIDLTMRLAVAYGKIALGRIRSKYTQTNALYQLDGNILLEEGNTELNNIREHLQANEQLIYPMD